MFPIPDDALEWRKIKAEGSICQTLNPGKCKPGCCGFEGEDKGTVKKEMDNSPF